MDTVSTFFSSESESIVEDTFIANDDGSYTPASIEQDHTAADPIVEQKKGGAALARQVMMIVAPALGKMPLLKQ